MADTEIPEVKEIVESYGYEEWQRVEETDDYEISDEKVKRSLKAIRSQKREQKQKAISDYDKMVAERNKFLPPHRRNKLTYR